MLTKKKSDGSRCIRVLLVAPTLPILGGQTVQAHRLHEHLKSVHDIRVTFQPINPAFAPAFQRIKYLRTLLTMVRFILDLLWLVPKCDVVHVFSASYTSFLLAPTPTLFISKLFRKPTILNYRSGEANDHLKRWRSAASIIRRFDRVIVPSEYLVDVFRKFNLSAKSIFNFVDAEKFPFRRREPITPVFLSNRNFESHYNVECVLRAFRVIQDDIPSSKLIIVGDGPQRSYLHREAIALGLENVDFRGRIAPEHMPDIYKEADIYLNSPSIDNMPGSILEAFSSGLPVVTTNAGGIPYIVDHERTGLLVDINDHEALARSSIRLVNDPTLASRISAAARIEVERYSWQHVRDQWLDVYRNVARKEVPTRT